VNDSFTLASGFTPVALTVSTAPQQGASTATSSVKTVDVVVTIGTNRPAVQSIDFRANGASFAMGTSLTTTWARPAGVAGPFSFSAVITYVDGTTETVTPTPASVQ
jgi:hypothetical protein